MSLIVILTRPCCLNETKQNSTPKSKVFFNNISYPKSRNFLSHPKMSGEANRLFARTMQASRSTLAWCMSDVSYILRRICNHTSSGIPSTHHGFSVRSSCTTYHQRSGRSLASGSCDPRSCSEILLVHSPDRYLPHAECFPSLNAVGNGRSLRVTFDLRLRMILFSLCSKVPQLYFEQNIGAGCCVI